MTLSVAVFSWKMACAAVAGSGERTGVYHEDNQSTIRVVEDERDSGRLK